MGTAKNGEKQYVHSPKPSASSNLLNASLCILVFFTWDQSVRHSDFLCRAILQDITPDPLIDVSLLLFLNISILFWLIGLLQGNFWLIDPFWTWIPLMIVQYYSFHPSAVFSGQYWSMIWLLGLWSLRLTHNYFRRENWQFGVREDWRYTLLAQDCGRHWWWVSFWTVGFLQQILLTGLTLPFYSILFTSPPPWNELCSLATVLCLLGILIAFVSDNQLHGYVSSGGDRPRLLRSGLWKFSRHPNYFGEQLFWWSLSLFSIQCGHYWALIGPFLNTLVLVETTRMTEKRMLSKSSRKTLYTKYQKTTSVWIPWFTTWVED